MDLGIETGDTELVRKIKEECGRVRAAGVAKSQRRTGSHDDHGGEDNALPAEIATHPDIMPRTELPQVIEEPTPLPLEITVGHYWHDNAVWRVGSSPGRCGWPELVCVSGGGWHPL